MGRKSLGSAVLLLTALLGLGTAGRADDPAGKRLVEVPLADAPAFAKRALVIGVDDYEVAQKLTACGNDARAFAALLRAKFGFDHVTVMTDAPDTPKALVPTGNNIRHQLRLLTDGVVPDQTDLVLFYSGHGARTHDAGGGDSDWLVPEDGDPADIAHSCVNYTEFKSVLDTRRPARAFLVVDACRDLMAGKGVAGSGFGAARNVPLGPQIAEMLSCQPTQISQEGLPADFRQSVFTHYLLKGLEGDPDATADAAHTTVTFDSLKTYVQGQVSQYVATRLNQVQLPAGTATLGGMVLARLPAPPVVVPPALPSPPVPAVPTAFRINPKDGATMVYIPPGSFTMGDAEIGELMDDGAPRTVTLSGYYLYRNDVTVAMYRLFCRETGRAMPPAPAWGWKDDHPVVNVTWDNAAAYCAWAGVRLPTEAQWEKAARGTDARKFPWGSEFDRDRLRSSRAKPRDAGSTAPVGSFPSGASPYGVLDMAGNVSQWCADWWSPDYWKTTHGADPPGPPSGHGRVLRGGSWMDANDMTDMLASSFRLSIEPGERRDFAGFRAAGP